MNENENQLDQINRPPEAEPEIVVNDYGATRDPAVVIEEADRTVLLTNDETIIIDKEPHFSIAPANRPRKVYKGMWGQAEMVTIGLAMLALLSVILLYILVVVPSNRDLEQQRASRDRLETELISARAKYGDITNTESQVAKLITSVDDFESRFLPVAATGRTALYQRLNGLIGGYGLVNTTGPDYTPLDIADQNRAESGDQERGRAKFRSLFPGIYVTMTLEGSYHDLRRFIREVETGNEFVVISAVELEPSDATQERRAETSSPVQPGPNDMNSATQGIPGFPGMNQAANPQAQTRQMQRPRGKTHGEVVSLRLEMAAYFRRSNAVPVQPETMSQ